MRIFITFIIYIQIKDFDLSARFSHVAFVSLRSIYVVSFKKTGYPIPAHPVARLRFITNTALSSILEELAY